MVVNGYTNAGIAPDFEDIASAKAKLRNRCAQLNTKVMRKAQTGTALAVEFEEKGGLTIANATKAGQTWVAQISAYAEPVTLTFVWENLAGTQTTSTLTFSDANETAFDPAITTGYKAISGSIDVENPGGVTVKVGVTGMANPVLIIGAGTQSTNLLTALTGTSIETAVQSGYQECGLSGLTETTETGLVPTLNYYYKIALNGGDAVEYYFTATTTAVTFAQLLVLLAGSKKVSDETVFSGATWSLTGGDLRCTSDLRTATSAVAITAGTTGTNLLGALTGFTSMETAVETAYQEAGKTGLTTGTATGLAPTTNYYFKLTIDGGSETEYYITTTATTTTYTQLIAALNAKTTGATWSIVSGDLRCTSDATTTSAAISLSETDLSGTGLFTSLTGFSAFDTAVETGYQEIGLTGKTESTDTGITPNTPYYFKLNKNGAGIVEYIVTTTTTPVTFNDLITALGSAVLQSDGVTPISGVTWSIVGGDLRCTSDERGATSAISITAGTSGTDLLATLTDFSSMDAAAYTAYQELGLSGRESENLTGLLASSQYYFKIAIDGGAAAEYDITTASDLSWTSILALMNTATTGAATWSLVGGDIRCTSDATDGSGSIALSAGTTGDDLFAQLTGFTTFDTAEYIGFQEFGLSGKTGTTETGLTTTKVYYYKINIDGAGEAEENITITAGSTLFSDVITLLNAGISGATFAINGGDLRCTSADLTSSAAIALSVAGLSGTSLFGSMTGFSAIEAAKGTGYQECGLAGKAGGTDTGLVTTQKYYYKINIDGAGVSEKNIDVLASALTYGDIISSMNTANPGATWSITGGDLRCTSDATTTSAAIAVTAGTSGTDLLVSLDVTMETAVHIGHQEFGLSGKSSGDATGLTATKRYYYKLNIDGGGISEYYIDVIYGSTTYADIIALLNSGISNAEFSITGGDLRCTGTSASTTTAIALSNATLSGTSLFTSLTGFSAFETALHAEYQEFGLSGKTAVTLATGLAGSTTYYYKMNINGGGINEYYITTYANVPSFAELIILLNNSKKVSDDSAITGITFSLTGGDIRCTSASTASTTGIAITGGRAIATAANIGGEGALYVYEETDTAADRGKVVSGEYITSSFARKYFIGTLNGTNSTTVSHALEATYVDGVLTASSTYVNDFYRRGKWIKFEQVAGKYIAFGSYGKTHYGVIEEGTDKSIHSRYTVPTDCRSYFGGIKAWANTANCAVTVTYTEYGSDVAKTLPLITIPSTSVLVVDEPVIPLEPETDCTITIVGNTSELTMEVTYIECVTPRNF